MLPEWFIFSFAGSACSVSRTTGLQRKWPDGQLWGYNANLVSLQRRNQAWIKIEPVGLGALLEIVERRPLRPPTPLIITLESNQNSSNSNNGVAWPAWVTQWLPMGNNSNESALLFDPLRKRGRMSTTASNFAAAKPPKAPRIKPISLLPAMPPEDHHKKTLVLDLDETLVHSSFKPTPNYDFVIKVEMEQDKTKGLHTIYVLKRPGVEEFLESMATLYEIVIFTAGLKQYADGVLDKLQGGKQIKHRLYRESCKQYMGGLVKDLSMLGRDLSKVVMVDNNPHCYMLQPRNAVPITSFIDNRDDRELLDLIPFLCIVAQLDNVTEALSGLPCASLCVDAS